MAIQVAPTKSNLMKAKSSLVLSNKGYELLDKKRVVLIKEMMALVDRAKNINSEISYIIKEAYRAMQEANIRLGVKNVEDISHSIPKNEEFDILIKSVMGADIPTVKYKKETIEPTYGFYSTNASLDKARQKFNEVKYKIYELAEIENSVFKLAKEIEKTQKRANALQYILIPRYQEEVKYIENVLEEKEREDFFRLKKIKK